MENYSFNDLYDVPALQAFINSLSTTLHIALRICGLQGEVFIRSRADEGTMPAEDMGIRIMIGDVHLANLLVGFPDRNGSSALGEEQEENILITLRYIGTLLSRHGHKAFQLNSAMTSLESNALVHQKERDALEQLAQKDSLTGLYNRNKFNLFLDECSKKTNMRVCIISADANFLKLTNDIFGHESGDTLLCSIADILKKEAQSDWLVSRCGGDEFRILLPNTSLDTALDYCKRVDRCCRLNESLPIPLSVALGVAQWNPNTETLEECFIRADEMMYQNKQAIKKELHIPDAIMERLYERQILNREVTEISQSMVVEFGRYLKLGDETINKLQLAIHYEDIGMIKVPELIMNSGQMLTPEDNAKIRAHVFHSNKLARYFEELYPIADILLHAHENWDGNGYPEQRMGSKSPVGSRIIRIVNNYVYWTNPTTLRANLSSEEAKKRLMNSSGKMYDPELVACFLDFLELKGL